MTRHFLRDWPGPARWAAPLVLLLLAGPAPADEFYYVAVFGAQRTPNDPNHSHCFATFVRACGDGPCPTTFTVEDCFTISWLPANATVRTHALLAECGHNFTLGETLDMAAAGGARVTMWGPYRIDEALYGMAGRRRDELESGRVRYKAIDSGFRTDRVSNCIHALTAVTDGDRRYAVSPGYGETASYFVLQDFQPHVADKGHIEEWVYSYLGLDKYPITRRDCEHRARPPVYWNMIKEAFRLLY